MKVDIGKRLECLLSTLTSPTPATGRVRLLLQASNQFRCQTLTWTRC